jgi:hypothetical protein
MSSITSITSSTSISSFLFHCLFAATILADIAIATIELP